MASAIAGQKPDGRRLRSERSKQVICDAMMELVNEGILAPTAQQVSDRANVGIRTVFRHFDDMASLFATHDEEARKIYEPLFVGGDRTGSLDERITNAVKRRANGFEHTWSSALMTQAQFWRFEELRKRYNRNQRGLRRDLELWLPELKDCSKSKVEAANAVTSFEMWHRLREHQNMSKQASINITIELLSSILKG